MSGRVRAVVLAVVVAALVGALLAGDRASHGPHMVVEDLGAARILHRERVWPGALFTLDYIHSSEGVPVRGTFRIEHEGVLTVVETAFAGFGPGLPQLKPGEDWRVEGGMIVHRPHGEPLNELRVRVTPVARQRLTTPAGRTLDLAALTPPGTPVLVSVR